MGLYWVRVFACWDWWCPVGVITNISGQQAAALPGLDSNSNHTELNNSSILGGKMFVPLVFFVATIWCNEAPSSVPAYIFYFRPSGGII